MSANKSWQRAWSTDEIIENSDKWNLAGDVALLNTLKSFADNLLTKTNEINNNLQNLTKDLSETSLRLDIAQNEFQSLRNTQFIESRVYEDDESLPQAEERKLEKKSEDNTEKIKLAALTGLAALDEFFDKVEVSVSDSEDEDIDLPNFVLRPKDLYAERPLPYVIGSEEWNKSWHVGLEDSSDSDTEKVSQFSESDSESDLPLANRSQVTKESDTSSELDFQKSARTKEYSSDSESASTNQNFAEQLAAKLHVVTQEPAINTRPIQTQKFNYGDVFFDEPPPLDEPKGMFSGGGGLFDDDFSEVETKKPEVSKGGLFDESDEESFAEKPSQRKSDLFREEPPAVDERKPVGGVAVFGNAKVFDKKLLKNSAEVEDKKEIEETQKKKIDLFSDDLFAAPTTKVSTEKVAKKVNLFDSDEDDNEDSLFAPTQEKDIKEKTNTLVKEREIKTKEDKQEEAKKFSLFEDDLFKDDLFSSTSTKQFTSSLFADIPGEDLFASNPQTGTNDLFAIPDTNSINSDLNPKPNLRLFDSPPPNPDDLFSQTSPDNSKRLFDSPPPDTDLFTTEDDLFDEVDTTFTKRAPSVSVFDPNPPPDDLETSPKSLQPGKLKHNLNINVAALMPGFAPPKRGNVAVSGDGSDISGTKSKSFDETDNVEVLQSVTKDRGRGPLNRRPSTRRGRKEALKRTDSEFKLKEDGENEKEKIVREESEAKKEIYSQEYLSEEKKGASLFESSGEDDLFGSNANIKKEDKTVTNEEKGLFDSHLDGLDTNLVTKATEEQTQEKERSLFDSPPPDDFLDTFKSPKSKENKIDELFDDDEGDDLFFTKKALPTVAKKSLFDDDDDDDIFKSFVSANAKKTETKVANEKKVSKVSVKKLENTKPDDDPLSALLK